MGVKQWIFQRISNALLILFGLWLLWSTISGGINYEFLQAALAGGYTQVFLFVVLVFGGVNGILAAWQIAGDYSEKFGLNQNLIVGLCTIVSLTYIVVGAKLLSA